MKERTRGPVSRWFDNWVRSVMYTRVGRRPSPRESRLGDEPEPEEVDRLARIATWVVAVVVPVAVCAALILVRDDVDRSTATLVLVLPVVLVAVIGGPGAAALAAVVGPLAFDVLLTRPYYRVVIHTAEDVEAALILLAVGLAVGQLVARETRTRARSSTRRDELDAVVGMVTSAARLADDRPLADQATAAVKDLLDLRDCRWSPGYHGGAYPVLTRKGDVHDERDSVRDLAPLPPTGVEVPVVAGHQELGRMILVPSRARRVSREERLIVIAIADVLALGLVGGRRS